MPSFVPRKWNRISFVFASSFLHPLRFPFAFSIFQDRGVGSHFLRGNDPSLLVFPVPIPANGDPIFAGRASIGSQSVWRRPTTAFGICSMWFLSPIRPHVRSLGNLLNVAVRRPVMIVNHCRWRSDIIILLHDSPPSFIPTANDFYHQENRSGGQLLDARKERHRFSRIRGRFPFCTQGAPPDRRSANDSKAQRVAHVPGQSLVWQCTVSNIRLLFSSASRVGPVLSDTGPPQYFLDFYIPSYTPTLSALIESNKSSSQTLGRPSLFLVLQ